jgi:hypothetical protein
VHVDETGCERETGAIDAFDGVATREIPDRDDLPVGDCDVGGEWRPAQAVIDPRALEDDAEQRLT